ncbi:GDSL-type esterase/lipase family protein [Streptomyces sp. NBC_01242]|uniref:GDSL-type esterase/lipase family protein n=2 Tax=Streptomyces TaxID=1883 RepID=UPI00225A42A6|nr:MULTISPECIES: GDSL-type esterase/lipase family protein [unclassified Streptomyces]MCX4794118.1 GDSL-type esterase/lipase family protein [Streptomyces sp. NBC_01242]WSJ35518.1 GDSL-type esterase/lipase family protein [Streptomyces sp. NBC_01321]WSP58399.1 GDSL-type esterase/lipase family protein [Streptomyces sp. NBC_01241]WSU21026.1 GDSL-type esterase/lipase family protein [Streptomyces sp. NBC_01108]
MRRRSMLLAAGAAALSTPLGGRAFAAAPRSGPRLDHDTPVDLDGSQYVDLSNRVRALAPLTAGTIVVTFRTTSHNEAMTLLSASDPTAPSSNITLNLSGGALQFSVREKGAVLINVMTRTRYDDGQRHTVAVTVDGMGTRLHAGGRTVLQTTQHSFFGSVSGLSALTLGRNLDSDHPGGEWFCTGTIERAAVWDRVLDEAELVEQSPRPDLADLGRISTILNSDTPATWVVTGDSITHGALHTNGWRSYPEHWTERVRWELGKPKNRDFVIDSGVSGATSAELLARFGERVTAFSPHVVSIMIGTNDIATSGLGPEVYRANLVSLVRAVRALPGSPVPVLQSPNPVDPAKWPGRVGLSRYAQIMGEVAAEQNAVFVDHYNDWLSGNGGQAPLSLLNDGLHPNERGHHRLVLKMIKDLRIFDATSRVCSLRIP